MNEFLQFVINAASLGSLYALFALGLIMVFGILKLVNFAYGELIMVAGYTWYLLQGTFLPLIFLLISAGVVAGWRAWPQNGSRSARAFQLHERDAHHLVRGEHAAAERRARVRLPAGPGVDVPTWFHKTINLGGADRGVQPAHHRGLHHSPRHVDAHHATHPARDHPARRRGRLPHAQLLGVRANQVIATAFLISGALAGVAGFLWISRIGSVSPTVCMAPLLIALIAIVVGGMNSLNGAIVGGFFMGALTIALQLLLPQDLLAFRDAVIFAIVILVLVVRPQGFVKGRFATERIG